jgi:hypothetical protein
MEHDEQPLQIGETVTYDNHGVGVAASGVIVERLGEEYIRVFWNDLSVTTTHHCHSLKRQPANWRGRH